MKELTLDEAYTFLVRSPERAHLIRALDRLMESYRKDDSVFVMPNHYGHLVVLVDRYALDRPGWVEFVREVAEQFPKRSDERMELQVEKRRIESAYDADVRRDRQARATQAANERHGPMEPADRREYSIRIQSWWNQRRKVILTRTRRQVKRLSHAEQVDLYAKFWQTVEDEIASQTLPRLEELPALIEAETQALARLPK